MNEPVFYPDLRIVPIAHIHLQEKIQKSRMRTLANSIERQGMLRNPPVVANFFNDTYLHLDGANRITAVSLLKYPNCLVQVIDYSDPTHVHLSSWSHLTKVNKNEFVTSIQKMTDLEITKVDHFNHQMLLQPHVLAVVQFVSGDVWEVTAKTSFTQLVKRLGDVVDLYAESPVERVFSGSPWTSESIHVRFERYPENNMFIAFPNFSPEQIIALVDRGVLMPAGVTRHIVYRRKLNIDLPLEYLKIEPIEKANEKLQKFLQHKTVRLYEEPIIYFE